MAEEGQSMRHASVHSMCWSETLTCAVVTTAFPIALALKGVSPFGFMAFALFAGALITAAQEALRELGPCADWVELTADSWIRGTGVAFLGAPFYVIALAFA